MNDQSYQSTTPSRTEFARLLAENGMDGVQVISHETAVEVLTDKRREIITALTSHEFESVRALARELNRDKAAVSRDLKRLAEHGIVDFETDGAAKRPSLQHDHLVVEPVF